MTFTLSAFGDEIAVNLAEQLQALKKLEINHLELRTVWDKNVLKLNDEEVARVREMCAADGISVSCIGSPIGKSPLDAPLEAEIANLLRAIEIARNLDVPRIRIFSFYPPDTSTNSHYDRHLPEVISRLAELAERAARVNITLLLENEKGIVADTPERCRAVLSAIDSPYLRLAWDPSNFIQVGVVRPTTEGWPLLAPYVGYVHVKDALSSDGSIRPAGEGDGQIPELLAELRQAGYNGFLALEPHLQVAGHSSGFSGPEGMARAVKVLRGLLEKLS